MTHSCDQTENIAEIKNHVQKLYSLSFPSWVRTILVMAIVSLFGMYGALWVYANQTYATKEDVKEIKLDISETLNEILREVKRK
jgi:hypothetical protein